MRENEFQSETSKQTRGYHQPLSIQEIEAQKKTVANSWKWLGRGVLLVPIISPIFIGMGQYVDWGKTEAIVINQETDEMKNEFFLSRLFAYRHKVTYKYAANIAIFQHTQARNDIEMFFSRLFFGAPPPLVPGQVIEIRVKKSNPYFSSYQPLPWVFPWSLYLPKKHLHLHPYRGKILKDFSKKVVEWETLEEPEKREWERKLGKKLPRTPPPLSSGGGGAPSGGGGEKKE
uniref:Uncharacterized protein n=1 Tax=Paramoeba aestuarina TaxID=180227 RepID=A0A7S4UM40_9EUKA|mmetsp:Transcript_39552/g.62542  ORF Transcript_39552/g.62542 Transcript_39552/m.62542 type:complete len:231 (+) Transcript_39552:97-789(+)